MENKPLYTSKDLTFSSHIPIGSGAFGKVYLAKITKTGQTVAVKTVYQDRRYKNRELSIMKELSHPNVVKLLSYYCTPRTKSDEVDLNCIMNYVPLTLSDLIRHNKDKNTKFPSILLKLYSFQMLKGIGYLHSLGICHRDIKPQNVLIDNNDYTLQICDFGCAKKLSLNEKNIAYICSRYYRPPELVIDAQFYSTQVDTWSIGCVIAELVLNRPLFPGRTANDQLIEILHVLGTPTKEQIKEMNPHVKEKLTLPKINGKDWNEVFKNKCDDPEFIDLVSKLLVYEPELRLSPYKALGHPFFDELLNSKIVLPNGKGLPSHLFEFTQSEIAFDKESIDYLLLARS